MNYYVFFLSFSFRGHFANIVKDIKTMVSAISGKVLKELF